MAGGGLVVCFLILQFFGICALLTFIGAWKIRTRAKQDPGNRGFTLWLSFGFCCAASLFDGLALLAGRAENLMLLRTEREAVLGFAAAATALALFGRGPAKSTLIATGAVLLLMSQLLPLSFLLSPG